jgi:hypothetical protein
MSNNAEKSIEITSLLSTLNQKIGILIDTGENLTAVSICGWDDVQF